MASSAGIIAAVTEVMPVIKEGIGVMPMLVESLGRPAFIAAIITVAAALAIWFWRRQRLLEQGA